LLAELKFRVAQLEGGPSLFVAETGHRRLTVRRRRRLVQIQETLAAATALVFNGEGLRGGRRAHCREKISRRNKCGRGGAELHLAASMISFCVHDVRAAEYGLLGCDYAINGV